MKAERPWKSLHNLRCDKIILAKIYKDFRQSRPCSACLVGLLVVLRINVDLAIFQPYLDLEEGDNHSLKIQVARPGFEPSSCFASQELNQSATTAPSACLETSSGSRTEGVPTNNQRGREPGPCLLWGGLNKSRHVVPIALLVRVQCLRRDMYKVVEGPSKRHVVLSTITGPYFRFDKRCIKSKEDSWQL